MAAPRALVVLVVLAAMLECAPGQLQCLQCPGTWAPVCGFDGVSTSAFSSYCAMLRFNCINRTNYRSTSPSACPALRRSYNSI